MNYKKITLLKSEFNKNINKNKEKFCIRYDKYFISILEILVIHGFIKKYIISQTSLKVYIFLKFYKGRSALSTFITSDFKLRKWSLQNYYNKNSYLLNKRSILIINTRYGLLDQYQARILKCSGYIVACIG